MSRAVTHIKFGNDQSKEYTITKGRILHRSIGMACRHVKTLLTLFRTLTMASPLILALIHISVSGFYV